MDLAFQQPKELMAAHDIPGNQAPKRGIFYRYQIPLGDLPQSKIGRVICQSNATSEALRVMLDEFMDDDHIMTEQITKVGFINLFTRRQNV